VARLEIAIILDPLPEVARLEIAIMFDPLPEVVGLYSYFLKSPTVPESVYCAYRNDGICEDIRCQGSGRMGYISVLPRLLSFAIATKNVYESQKIGRMIFCVGLQLHGSCTGSIVATIG